MPRPYTTEPLGPGCGLRMEGYPKPRTTSWAREKASQELHSRRGAGLAHSFPLASRQNHRRLLPGSSAYRSRPSAHLFENMQRGGLASSWPPSAPCPVLWQHSIPGSGLCSVLRQASLVPGSEHPKAGQGREGDLAVRALSPRCSSPRISSLNSEAGSLQLEEDSEVFKMLQENREGRAAPRQSSSFRLLQEALEAEERGGTPAIVPSSLSPQSSLPTSRALATPPKLHTCEKCSTSIMNQAVRIQEGRYRHPGCYTCADCGLNLKMRGHFWVGDELYCEKHARQRYSAPSALSSRS
ncbi:PDZ and LIM domain protein 2 isoform X3 [Octodon degus]|uniref:PDZ and LIM domain protein 2 isoform X3 n=1 Tax=Octodon degus TaxID=10160 RepID=A0A6P6EDE6_OCTDE|nr:PDZ and LIM domain protein 2 isoform X3 [Octodon degus]